MSNENKEKLRKYVDKLRKIKIKSVCYKIRFRGLKFSLEINKNDNIDIN